MRLSLTHHEVTTTYELGWSKLTNGELLDAAEGAGYEVFVTTDSNLQYQQNLSRRRLGVVVLLSTSWPRIQQVMQAVVEAIDGAGPGMCREVDIPRERGPEA